MKNKKSYLNPKSKWHPDTYLDADLTINKLLEFLENNRFVDKSGIKIYQFYTELTDKRYKVGKYIMYDDVTFSPGGKITEDNPIILIYFDKKGYIFNHRNDITSDDYCGEFLGDNCLPIKKFTDTEEFIKEINKILQNANS